MASRTIEYIWKVARPKNETFARGLLYAAHKTAMQLDPTADQVLIRSYVHITTFQDGEYVKDEPHITISLKNPKTAASGEHNTAHDYTPALESYNVIRVQAKGPVRPDHATKAWPREKKPSEIIAGEPGLLGPEESFYSWASEETGE